MRKKGPAHDCIGTIPIVKTIACASTQAAEQVLLVRPRQAGGAQGAAAQGASEPELSLQYLRPPQTYIDAAYPLVRREGRGLAKGWWRIIRVGSPAWKGRRIRGDWLPSPKN